MCGVLAHTGKGSFDTDSGLDQLAHRGPDARGALQGGAVTLGHRRLSIIDVSHDSDQPMVSASGKTAITYNGEIYNYQELRNELVSAGISLRTKGDTEVILEGYERFGVAFFSKLRGMWAFVIHDRERNALLLGRDPFGIKPLFYAHKGSELFAASELRCLRSYLSLVPDPRAYTAFFALGYFIAPNTPYRDVYKMRTGEVLTWSLSTNSFTDSIRMPRLSGAIPEFTADNCIEQLDGVLTNAVAAHYVSDVPVSMLLSGGTDSSLIAALSVKLGKKPVAYHVAIAGSTDTPYAEKIASHLGIELVREELTADALREAYQRVHETIDEPTGDISIIPTSLIFRRIKGQSRVVLSGEGGDELFGGYLRHRTLARHARVRVAHLAHTLLDGVRSKNAASRVWNPLVERVRTGLLSRGIIDDLVGAYLTSTRLAPGFGDDLSVRTQLALLFESDSDPNFPASLALDLVSYLPNDLLPKSDAASMAVSIEARVPLVDREVVRASAAAHRLRGAPTGDKQLLKEVLARYIPHDLAFRGKSGFGVPIAEYALAEFTDDFRAACAFHLAERETFGLTPKMVAYLGDKTAHAELARKFPRLAFALISNHRYFTL